MKLLLQLTGLLSVATAGFAGQHNIHKNRAAHQELAKREPGHVSLHKRFEGSKWSYYDGHTGQAGACGEFISNDDFTVALNTPQYEEKGRTYPGRECFKTITLSYGGKTAVARIMDECPGCPYGGLDLTPALFKYFDSPRLGIIYGDWTYGEADSPPKSTRTPPPPPPPTSTWKPSSSSTSTRTPKSTTSTTSTTEERQTSAESTSSRITRTRSSTETSTTATTTSTTSSVDPTGLTGPIVGEDQVLLGMNVVFVQFGNVVVTGGQS